MRSRTQEGAVNLAYSVLLDDWEHKQPELFIEPAYDGLWSCYLVTPERTPASRLRVHWSKTNTGRIKTERIQAAGTHSELWGVV